MRQQLYTIGSLWVVLAAAASDVFAQAHGGVMPNRVPPPKPQRAEKMARAEHPLDRWMAMPPEQRERAMAKLPPERRANLDARLAKWAAMTPEQKERARDFAAMPVDQRKIVTQHAEWMQTLPQDRRQIVRKEINSLQHLSPEARQAELESPSFSRRFDASEREHIAKMIPVMPE